MHLLAGQLCGAEGPKLQLSSRLAPILKPVAATLASCTAVLEGAQAWILKLAHRDLKLGMEWPLTRF